MRTVTAAAIGVAGLAAMTLLALSWQPNPDKPISGYWECMAGWHYSPETPVDAVTDIDRFNEADEACR
jgi:hypothetical protein